MHRARRAERARASRLGRERGRESCGVRTSSTDGAWTCGWWVASLASPTGAPQRKSPHIRFSTTDASPGRHRLHGSPSHWHPRRAPPRCHRRPPAPTAGGSVAPLPRCPHPAAACAAAPPPSCHPWARPVAARARAPAAAHGARATSPGCPRRRDLARSPRMRRCRGTAKERAAAAAAATAALHRPKLAAARWPLRRAPAACLHATTCCPPPRRAAAICPHTAIRRPPPRHAASAPCAVCAAVRTLSQKATTPAADARATLHA
eukprot:353109-Chlamydomonas_euryale.AAC.2